VGTEARLRRAANRGRWVVAVAAESAGVGRPSLKDIIQQADQPLGEDTVGLTFRGEPRLLRVFCRRLTSSPPVSR
jgi:hypothetical protein